MKKIDVFKIKRNGRRKYAHFDKRLGLLEAYNYVSNPENIITHNFYPFIYYEQKMCKFSQEKYLMEKSKPVNEKIRPICYASHIDRCIFQYYSSILNVMYNEKVNDLKIDDCSIAYRSNKNKSNIHFAKEVFDFIKNTKNALVIVGDFKGFFDNLDHQYLKKQLCKLMDVKKLPEDIYAVYKNMTKFSKCRLEDILTFKGLKNIPKDIRKLNSNETVMNLEEFKLFKKRYLIKNDNNFGIPQGSSLSGIFSNVYMMDFDFKLKEIAMNNNGLYRRYSDDFIIIVPYSNYENCKFIKDKIMNIINEIPGVSIEKEKTKLYVYADGTIENITSKIEPNVNDEKRIINYLGFSFDGKTISIREKTICKYRYRLRRTVDRIEKNGRYTKKHNRISLNKLYERYSKKGLYKGKSNFIGYIRNSEEIFAEEKAIVNIDKKHMSYIAKTIKQKQAKYKK